MAEATWSGPGRLPSEVAAASCQTRRTARTAVTCHRTERSRALAEAQRIAEQMTASGEITLPEEAEGFVFDGTGWEKQVGKVVIRVEAGSSDTAAGRMREGFIRLTDGDELLTELDLALYLPGEVER